MRNLSKQDIEFSHEEIRNILSEPSQDTERFQELVSGNHFNIGHVIKISYRKHIVITALYMNLDLEEIVFEFLKPPNMEKMLLSRGSKTEILSNMFVTCHDLGSNSHLDRILMSSFNCRPQPGENSHFDMKKDLVHLLHFAFSISFSLERNISPIKRINKYAAIQ